MSLTWRATSAVGSVTIQVRPADILRRKPGDDPELTAARHSHLVYPG